MIGALDDGLLSALGEGQFDRSFPKKTRLCERERKLDLVIVLEVRQG